MEVMRSLSHKPSYFSNCHFILLHGDMAAEPMRSAFIASLLSFADLEDYPRREAFAKAFSEDGKQTDRIRETAALVKAEYLEMPDYEFALMNAASPRFMSQHNHCAG